MGRAVAEEGSGRSPGTPPTAETPFFPLTFLRVGASGIVLKVVHSSSIKVPWESDLGWELCCDPLRPTLSPPSSGPLHHSRGPTALSEFTS